MTNITPLDFDPNRRDRDRDDRRPHLRGVPDERNERYQGIGTEFAAARLQTGMDIAQVATTLRIRKEHLSAIEEGRFVDLPAPAYALGFVRSYADYLGLDAAAAVEAFKQETSTSRRRTPLVFPTAEPMDRMPRGWLLGLSAVLAAVVFGAWYYSERAGQAVVDRVPPPGAEGVTRPPATSPTAGVAATDVRAARPAAAPAAPAVPAANDAAIARVLGTLPATALPAAAPEPVPPAPRVQAPAPRATAVPTPPALPAGPEAVPPAVPTDIAGLTQGAQVFGATDGRVIVLAKQDSWVQVTGAAGELLLTRILRAGDKYIAPQREDLVMMTGNAGALEVLVDGNTLPPLGPVGTVRRNVSLSAEKLLNGTAIQP